MFHRLNKCWANTYQRLYLAKQSSAAVERQPFYRITPPTQLLQNLDIAHHSSTEEVHEAGMRGRLASSQFGADGGGIARCIANFLWKRVVPALLEKKRVSTAHSVSPTRLSPAHLLLVAYH